MSTAILIPTLEVPLSGDGKYHCPECNEPYIQRRGLGSHRRREHDVRGTSPSVLSVNKKLASGQVKLPFSPILKKPLTKKLSSKASTHPKFAKRIAKGGLSCDVPGCTETGFTTPAHVGRHKRFDHGIIGTGHLSAKAKRELGLPVLKKKLGRPSGTSKTGLAFPCQVPDCTHKPFKTQGRLTNHMRKFHPELSSSTGIVHAPQNALKGQKHGSSNGTHHNLPQDIDGVSRTILPEVYDNTVGQIQGWLLALAAQNDIPPKYFAARVARDLYDQTRRS